MKQPIIKTKHFILRPFKKSDAKSIAENLNNKIISRYISNIPYPYKLKDADDFIKKSIRARRKKNPELMIFVIEIGGEAVGSIGIHGIKMGHKASIGYWLGENYWGKGIMSKAVKEIVNYGFKELKLRRIFAYTFVFNKASMRVLEKNGFKFEGIVKKHIKKGDKFFDAHLFAKVK